MLPPWAVKVAPAGLRKVPAPSRLPALRLMLEPDQTKEVSLRRVRPPSRPRELVRVAGPRRMVLPVPVKVALASEVAPLTVTVPVPARVPEVMVNAAVSRSLAPRWAEPPEKLSESRLAARLALKRVVPLVKLAEVPRVTGALNEVVAPEKVESPETEQVLSTVTVLPEKVAWAAVMVAEGASVWVPPPNSMVPAPENVPVWAPPLLRLSVPVRTSTVPVLAKGTLTLVTWAGVLSVLRNAPSLRKRAWAEESVLE